MVALIPARTGSKRCPGKNTRDLAGHPLIAYAIGAAQASGVFAFVLVCTDDDCIRADVDAMGAGWMARSPVADDQPDIEWVRQALTLHDWDAFAILRPTSPFRTAATIRRAYSQFKRSEVHSLRAVEPVKQHPFKMWTWAGAGYPIQPLFDDVHSSDYVTPWHSMPTQTLQPMYVQNASLEMAWSYVVPAFGTISGKKIAPFFTEGYEGFDINTEDDWDRAATLVRAGRATLPPVPLAPLRPTP